jgi:hypothetical protein
LAQRRAWQALYQLRANGFANIDASLAAQLRTANAMIISHLDYVASLAGSLDRACIQTNEEIVTAVLRLIAGNARLDPSMLRIESGTWDQCTRIQMLQLRFACKLSLSSKSTNSIHYRAFRLSLAELQHDTHAKSAPLSRYRRQPWKRTWIQSLLPAADSFQRPGDSAYMERLTPVLGSRGVGVRMLTADHPLFCAIVNGGCHPAAALVRVESRNAVANNWSEVEQIDSRESRDEMRLRLSSRDDQPVTNYANGVQEFAWESDKQSAFEAASTWSAPLKNALFASLRKRGNIARAKIVESHIASWRHDSKAGRTFVLWKSASYLEPYWFIPDTTAARRLLRARLDWWGDEYSFRRAVHGVLPRLERHQRACYLCEKDNWMPESLEHLLIKCSHPELVELRTNVRSELDQIFQDWSAALAEEAGALARVRAQNAQRNMNVSGNADVWMLDPDTAASIAADAVMGKTPDLTSDSTLLTVLMCCTSGGSTVHRPIPADVTDDIDARRRRPEISLESDEINCTASWLRSLSSAFQRAVATGSLKSARASLSQRFLKTVAQHSQQLFSLRRKLLRDNEEFQCRGRDPQPLPSNSAESAARQQQLSQQSARRPRTNRAS